MEVLTKTELNARFEEISEKIFQGAIFIYPTDTVYGIGCNALNGDSVQKIRNLKTGRETAPFSIIVPSLDWIKINCKISRRGEKCLKALPGPYTLLLPLKNKNVVSANVAPEKETIGVRFPNHWFTSVVNKLNIPIVTTSANKSGEPFMTSLENLDPEIEKGIEFMLYEGLKEGRPSKLVNVEKGEIIER
jgi:tRNA threonylcarbamoyl adenosine modification protein (Sua5/YciO/YrdC/YwlC family)